jgi:hypothetical protein
MALIRPSPTVDRVAPADCRPAAGRGERAFGRFEGALVFVPEADHALVAVSPLSALNSSRPAMSGKPRGASIAQMNLVQPHARLPLLR